MKKTKKEKKRLFVISAVIILLIVSLVSSVAGDWTKIMENKSKITIILNYYFDLKLLFNIYTYFLLVSISFL